MEPRPTRISRKCDPVLSAGGRPEAFRAALAAGDFDRAFAMLDKSDEEIHEQLTKLREHGYDVADRHPDVFEGDMPDELRADGKDGR